MLELLTPDVFDALIIANIVIGLCLAGRRFRQDLRAPLPEEAPDWARARESARSSPSPSCNT